MNDGPTFHGVFLDHAKNRGLFDEEGPEQGGLFSRRIPGFYSQLQRVIGDKNERSPGSLSTAGDAAMPPIGSQGRGTFKWTSLDQFVEDQKDQRVTKQQVMYFVKANEVRLEERRSQ